MVNWRGNGLDDAVEDPRFRNEAEESLKNFDATLPAIWLILPTPKNLDDAREAIAGAVDRVTHTRPDDWLTHPEPNGLVTCDWRRECERADHSHLSLQLSMGGLQCLAKPLRLLDSDQHHALGQVLSELAAFAWKAKTPAIAKIIGTELRAAIEVYLAFRNYELPEAADQGDVLPDATYLGNRRVQVGANTPVVLQESEETVLVALIELGGSAKLDELRLRSGKDDANKVIKSIREHYPELAPFIDLPGVGGKTKGGYRTRIQAGEAVSIQRATISTIAPQSLHD